MEPYFLKVLFLFIDMAKDPAFLFYPNDYLGGTLGMTFEEKGAYMELLMLQFNRGHMGGHMIGQTVGQLWDKVQDKFIQDSEGLWYNERLDAEKMKRKRFTESRKNNLEGKNQHSKKEDNSGHMDGHTTSRMENENENRNKDVNAIKKRKRKKKKFVPPTLDQVRDYFFLKLQDKEKADIMAELFFSNYTENGWMRGDNEMKSWKGTINTWIARDKGKELNNKQQNNGNDFSPEAIKHRMEHEW